MFLAGIVAVDKRDLVETGETVLGSAWFFHDDRAAAHSAVKVEIPCRVYRDIQGVAP